MRKQYLWVDRRGADLHWPALGNLDISASGKGTLAMWVRLPVTSVDWPDNKLWTIYCDASNWVSTSYGRAMAVCSGGVVHQWPRDSIYRPRTPGAWEFLVFQWDFTQQTVQGFYNGATPGANPLTGVPAPVGTAQYLQLGYPFSSPTVWATDNLQVHGLAIWDDLMTPEQMTALYQSGRLAEFQESDGSGNLTFLLRLNESLEADVAGGDSHCTVGATTPADRYCFLNEGLRKLGTMTYPIGMPRHDGSEDDRKPLNAVLPLSWNSSLQYTALSDTNNSNYSILRLQNYTETSGAGASMPSIPLPGTLRQIVHVPDQNNQAGTEMGLGPFMYKHYPSASTGVFDQFGSGRMFTVVSDTGNTATAFKTDLDSRFGDNYWSGAWASFYSGTCQGRTLKVASYNATSKVLTLETALPAVPAAGDKGAVNPYPRVIGRATSMATPDYTHAMEANLWAHHDADHAFTELEWGNSYAPAFVRYQRGRTTVMPGVATFAPGTYQVLYGKGYRTADAPSTNLEVWVRKIELSGPQKYQVLRRNPKMAGPALADNFLVLTRDNLGNGGDSVKVWRKQNLNLVLQTPTKYPSFDQVTADLQASGTWRHLVVGPPTPIAYDETGEVTTCAIIGKDSAGALHLGYVQGHWDEATGRILWQDEPAPTGKHNPPLEVSTLRTDYESDTPIGDVTYLINILQSIDGTWSLFYENKPDGVDDYQTYALHGAADRWSFDYATQFAGPVVPMFKGVDSRDPVTGSGFVPWANMHLPWSVVENPYAQQVERRFIGFSGGKTIFNDGATYSMDMRPVVGCAGADTKSLAPLPYGNAVTPLVAPEVHTWAATVLGQEDCLAMMYDYGNTTGVGLMTSEDGIHFQRLFSNWPSVPMLIPPQQLPGESYHLYPGSMLRLGDRRVYYYSFNAFTQYNFAWTRWNGESHYEPSSGQTEGWLETPILERPAEGWPELFLNAAPGGGQIRAELRDPATELALDGWGQEDCDAVSDQVKGRASWGSLGLSQFTGQYVRLRFYLTAGSSGAAPALYGWETGALTLTRPEVGALQVEGHVAPAGLGAAHPHFSWSYTPSSERAQAAYQVQVASSEELLAAGQPDMWDSGVVAGSATSTVYEGQALGDYEMYFWRVRARDTEGVWSEEW